MAELAGEAIKVLIWPDSGEQKGGGRKAAAIIEIDPLPPRADEARSSELGHGAHWTRVQVHAKAGTREHELTLGDGLSGSQRFRSRPHHPTAP